MAFRIGLAIAVAMGLSAATPAAGWAQTCPAGLVAAECGVDQFLPDSRSEPIHPYALADLSAGALRIARNEIFARHGRRFSDPELQAWFEARSWYAPSDGDIVLSEVEAQNVRLIAMTEESRPPNEASFAQLLPSRGTAWTAYMVEEGAPARRMVHSNGRLSIGGEVTSIVSVYGGGVTDSFRAHITDGWGLILTGRYDYFPDVFEPETMRSLNLRITGARTEAFEGESVTAYSVQSAARPALIYGGEWVMTPEETAALPEGHVFPHGDDFLVRESVIEGEIWMTRDGIPVRVRLPGYRVINEGLEFWMEARGVDYSLTDIRREEAPDEFFEMDSLGDISWSAPG